MDSTISTRIAHSEAWMQQAVCVGQGDLFFSDHMRTVVRKAKLICSTCPVRQQCLDYALKGDELGVWGGLTANERRKLKRVTKTKLGLSK